MENITTSSTENQEIDSVAEVQQQEHVSVTVKQETSVESWTPEGGDSQSTSDGSVMGEINENSIIDAISTVYDPEIPVNVYELGLIYAVDLHDDGRVNVEMTLTAPNCPSAQELPVMIQQAIEKVAGVTQVKVEVVWDPPWDVSRMSDEARLTLNMF